MIGFLLRKNFYDFWDNLFRVVLLNLGFVLSMAVPVGGAFLAASVPALSLAAFALGILWCFVYLAAAALVLRKVSDYGSFGFADFAAAIKDGAPAGLVLGVVAAAAVLLASVVLPFYFSLGSLFGVFAAALVFWTLVVCAFALQYYLPLRARLDRDPRAILKKCFILFFDNPGFSVLLALCSVPALVASLFVGLLLPGPAAVVLFLDQALRLRLLKYDYLEKHPGANRRAIPWDELLAEDREATGTRTLRGLIFPWKD